MPDDIQAMTGKAKWLSPQRAQILRRTSRWRRHAVSYHTDFDFFLFFLTIYIDIDIYNSILSKRSGFQVTV